MALRMWASSAANALKISGTGAKAAAPAFSISRYFSTVLDGLKYTSSHEWVKDEGGVATVGITDHAQSSLVYDPGISKLQDLMDALTKAVNEMAAILAELTTKVSALAPLVPIAASLEALPAKVTSPKVSITDGAQQVQAQNLAVARLEKERQTASDPDSSSKRASNTKGDGILGHLGEVVFVELPDPGTKVSQGSAFGNVESVKATSDVNSPISGEVVEINSKLTGTPGLINTSPYEDGWMIKVKPSSPAEVDSLLDAAKYTKHCEEEDAHH
ncbi:hypothetical protein ACP70R_019491 [Stipagrostis hirtigluma subsp. patula]